MTTISPAVALPTWAIHARNIILIALIVSAFMAAAAFGFEGSDGRYYYAAAMCWLNHGPCVDTEHWSLRLPPILLTALSFRVWGVNEFALVLPQVILYGILLTVNYLAANIFFNKAVALWTTVIVASIPLFVQLGVHLNVDIFETVLVVVSFWLIYAAGSGIKARSWLLTAAGVAASLAWLTRETTAAFLLFVAVLFLLDRRYSWRDGLWFALGAAPLILIEAGFWIRTGSPFYRLHVDLGHTQIHSNWLEGGVTGTIPLFNVDLAERWQPGGIFDIHWLINPYINLLLHAHMGLLIPFALLAALAIASRRDQPSASRIRFLLLALGVVWFLFVNYVLSLRAWPRYYGPFLYAAAFVFGLWIADLMRRRPGVAAAMVVVFLATAWPLVETSWNHHDIFASKQLAGYLATSGQHVRIDSDTLLSRSRFYLDVYGVPDRAEAGPLADADLVFCRVVTTGPCMGNNGEWVEVWRVKPEVPLITRVVTQSVIASLLPERVVGALQSRNSSVAVYQRLAARP